MSSLDDDAAIDIAADAELDLRPSDAALIHAEMVNLSVKHREVVLLRYIEELSYEQIAEVLGCTVGTVRSRLHYAKTALRLKLESNHERTQDA